MASFLSKHLVLASLIAGLSLVACGGGSTGPQATFAVTEGKQELAGVPWPSDLLLDASGHIALDDLPLDDTVVKPALLIDLATEQDGFGVFTGAYFPIGRYTKTSFGSVAVDLDSGSVDEASIAGNVHLLPLSCTDGFALPQDELAVYTHLREKDAPQRIYARPERGIVLRERCTYAYVITSKVKTDKGALGPSDDLAAVLDDSTPDGRLARAYASFQPLRTRLASGSITVADVAAATVFTTHSITKDYLAARKLLIAAGTPKAKVTYVFARTKTAADDGTLEDLFGTPAAELPGNDNVGGIAHAGIEYVIQGSYETADFLGGTTKNALGVDVTAAGIVEHDGDKPRVKGTITVPFTIVIPVGADLTKLKFAVVQHGLGVERRWLVPTANTLALQGIASILIDLPFHGARNKEATDAIHDFTMAAGPDGFGEAMADSSFGFFDVTGNAAGGIPSLLPRAIRAAFFQSVCDILQAFRLMASGDVSAIGAREPRLATLKFDDTHEVFVGESFGSMIGTIVATFEPKLDGAVLDVDGGGTIFPLLLNSAQFAPIFGTLLNGGLGTKAGDNPLDPRDTDWGYNLAEAMFDGGDSLAFAQYVVQKQSWGAASPEEDRPCHILQLSAYKDELVPNPANLAVARSFGLQPLTLADGVAPDLSGWPGVTAATGQLSANLDGQTAVFVQFREASHGMMSERVGAHNYDLSNPDNGMPKLATPIPIANPTDRVHAIIGPFVADVLAGKAPTVK